QYPHDFLGLEFLLSVPDNAQELHDLVPGLFLGLWVSGIVIHIGPLPVDLIEFLPKIMEYEFSAGHGSFRIGHDLLQQGASYLLFGHGLAGHELFKFFNVLIGVEGQTMPFSPIPARTARFLIVALNALGNVVVDHKTHIGLVDSHTKGYGGHHDVHILHQEHVLVFGTGLGIKARVVGHRTDFVDLKDLCQFLHLFSAETIDDAGLSPMLFYKTDDVRIHILGLGPDLIKEVGPVERGLEDLGIDHPQVFDDVLLYLWGRRGGKADYRDSLPQTVDDSFDVAVLRPEIMAPFRYAVGLV